MEEITPITGTQLISIAHEWYRNGVTPIPLYYASKHAAVYWKEWSQATPSWSTVVEAFATPLYRGIGLLMGNGLVVLDFDTPLPYVRWKQLTGIESYTVKTGRGFHVYFILDEPPNTTLSMEGGEVKGNGYVVAPPSTHHSGKQYRILPNGINWPVSARNLHELGVMLTVTEKRLLDHPTRSKRDSTSSLVDRIKHALPLTTLLSRYTQLEPTSDDFMMGICPFHDDHNPSLWVNTRLQICSCFSPSCPAHGWNLDIINAYSLLTGIRNGESIIDLAQQLGLN